MEHLANNQSSHDTNALKIWTPIHLNSLSE